jgi:hypothetical protein
MQTLHFRPHLERAFCPVSRTGAPGRAQGEPMSLQCHLISQSRSMLLQQWSGAVMCPPPRHTLERRAPSFQSCRGFDEGARPRSRFSKSIRGISWWWRLRGSVRSKPASRRMRCVFFSMKRACSKATARPIRGPSPNGSPACWKRASGRPKWHYLSPTQDRVH